MHIYVIRNKVTKKVYVGRTVMTVRKRWANHIYESFNKDSKGYHLYFHRSIRKHGRENFEFYKIYDFENPNVTEEQLNACELYFIKKYNSCVLFENSNGYNLTYGGEGCLGHGRTPVDVYSKDLKFIDTYPSIEETAKIFNLQSTNIQAVMKGRCKSAGDLIFCKKGEQPIPFINEQKTKIDIYDSNKQFKTTCNSMCDAADYLNSSTSSVFECCNGNNSFCKDHICVYSGTDIKLRVVNNLLKTKVDVFDFKTNILLGTYNSIRQATDSYSDISFNSIRIRVKNPKSNPVLKNKYIIRKHV